MKGKLDVAGRVAFVEEHIDERLVENRENGNADYRYCGNDDQLCAEGVSDVFNVALAVELRGEYSCAGNSAEYEKDEYEGKLVYDGNAAHLLCAEGADHNIVKHINEVGYAVLDDHWYNDGENAAVKLF